MGDLIRNSRPVLSADEIEALLRAGGKTDAEIAQRLNRRALATARAQARYDKAPPRFYRRVPK